jgi:formaldehyde-activating enzyme involved in methanogenesis
MLVLAGLSTSAGTGTDQLALTIGIDGTDSFYTVAAYPLAQVGLVPCFVQAQHTITIYATTQTAETVAVAAEIWHVARTPVINARLQQAVATAVTDAVEAGTL